MPLKGQAKTDYMRQYMRARRREEIVLKGLTGSNGRGRVTKGFEPNPSIPLGDASQGAKEDPAPVLTIERRKQLLSRIALRKTTLRVNPVQAIQELNKMEGSYAPTQVEVKQQIATFVFVLPDGRRVEPKALVEVTEPPEEPIADNEAKNNLT